MLVVYNYGEVIHIDIWMPFTMDVWSICYIILGSFVVIFEIDLKILDVGTLHWLD